jgi:hypothetical protein
MTRSELAFRSRMIRLELAKRRRPAADRRVQVLRITGEGGPELVDDELEAALERLAQRVVDEVGLHGLRDLLDRDRAALGERVSLARLAVDEVLGDERLGLRGAGRVLRELAHRAGRRERDDRPLVLVDVERGDSARLHAGDPDQRALHDPEGVVELDLVVVRVVGARDGRCDARGGREEYRCDDRQAPHGPGGT